MKQAICDKLFEGLNVGGAVLTLLAAVAAIASTTRLSAQLPYLLPLAIIVFVAGQLLIVIARVGLTRIPLKPRHVVVLVGLHILLSFWDVIAIVIGLPVILITMVLGPMMVVVLVLASVVLGMYLIEEVIGHDLQGYISVLERPSQAFTALVVWAASLLVLMWHVGRHESADWVLEKAADAAHSRDLKPAAGAAGDGRRDHRDVWRWLMNETPRRTAWGAVCGGGTDHPRQGPGDETTSRAAER